LSSCVEAIVAAQCGNMEKATEYALAALLMDLDDIGGNVKNGCHIASMGGTWMVFAYGFGDLRDYDGVLSFCPRRAPEMTGLLRFPLTYRGQVLEVDIGTETVEYTLREGESLVIHHEGEEVRLTRDQPKAFRQVRQW
jgi:alpha,alpha-trehalose phosphorylase